jgi:hypothetical protein
MDCVWAISGVQTTSDAFTNSLSQGDWAWVFREIRP